MNDQQGVLRDIRGRLKAIGPDFTREALGPDHFPLPLQDMDFNKLVGQLRDLAREPLRGRHH